jgi:hypothetical protein
MALLFEELALAMTRLKRLRAARIPCRLVNSLADAQNPRLFRRQPITDAYCLQASQRLDAIGRRAEIRDEADSIRGLAQRICQSGKLCIYRFDARRRAWLGRCDPARQENAG